MASPSTPFGSGFTGTGPGISNNLSGLQGLFSGGKPSFLSGIGDFLGSKGAQGLFGLGSLALQGYGLNKSLGIAEDQLGILKDQENRAATAQNLGTGNQLSLALQTTTPGSPEHERIKQAIASGEFAV